MTDKIDAKKDPKDIEAKILHILKIYPIISPTMLQGGLGPQLKPKHWRPVLEALLKSGGIVQTQRSMPTHQKRYNSYAMLHLPKTELDHLDG